MYQVLICSFLICLVGNFRAELQPSLAHYKLCFLPCLVKRVAEINPLKLYNEVSTALSLKNKTEMAVVSLPSASEARTSPAPVATVTLAGTH